MVKQFFILICQAQCESQLCILDAVPGRESSDDPVCTTTYGLHTIAFHTVMPSQHFDAPTLILLS